jgi:hypothetical protein
MIYARLFFLRTEQEHNSGQNPKPRRFFLAAPPGLIYAELIYWECQENGFEKIFWSWLMRLAGEDTRTRHIRTSSNLNKNIF